MILVNITYSIVTPESAENHDAAESGMLSENESMTFRELVEWMRGGEAARQRLWKVCDYLLQREERAYRFVGA